MKWFHVLALGASVWLAGCAAPTPSPQAGGDGPVATAPPAPRVQPQPAHGEMSPVAVTELRSRTVAPLDAPADLWERVRRGFAQRDAKLGHLRARGEIAGKKDHPAHARMRQPVALGGAKFGSGNADHEHAVFSSDVHCEYGRSARVRL